ncbi:hypothetical protein HanRHA438_Chr06g0287681 [Helianthus annuus]|nr:hypothetical protein HanRHA438_Chr06g0287681 [Helianthus annuus]
MDWNLEHQLFQLSQEEYYDHWSSRQLAAAGLLLSKSCLEYLMHKLFYLSAYIVLSLMGQIGK